MDKSLKDLGLQDAHTREQSNETRQSPINWKACPSCGRYRWTHDTIQCRKATAFKQEQYFRLYEKRNWTPKSP